MTTLIGQCGLISWPMVSVFKLGFIFVILMGIIANTSSEASPVPSSPRRHPPLNGSMFGKRSVLLPIVGWASRVQDQSMPSSPSSPPMIITEPEYQWKAYRRLGFIISKAIDQCVQELGQIGEINMADQLEAICFDFFANQIIRSRDSHLGFGRKNLSERS